ncbi:MAG TPA: radical SAM family heme chaperone HemW, partial [Gammaproteobacteria bacterium]|nr:radical SAM family heme chaperone HemW [Gammaproteobacteria bacterium]
MLTTPPLSLYIHLPWCMRKCPYCDFNSHPLPPVYDYAAYVDALLADLRFELGSIQRRTLETIFIGGGTPSLFPANQVKRVLDAVFDLVPCAKGVEVTLEANPGRLEGGRYAGYREAGINRLSIGVQSFNDRALQRLGRIHGADMALRAFFLAREAGFENINLDLMFGLPMQTVDEAGLDLETAITLAPEHTSYYQLTIEPNTRFAVAPPPLPEEGRLWNIQTRGQKMLA